MKEAKFSRSKLITINALLCAIICLFIVMPLYAIGPVELAVIPLIAIIISAEFVGLKNGIFTGFFFGLISMITAFTHPDLLAQVFYNPLVSVFPRIFIGVSSYFVMHGVQKLFPRLNPLASYGLGAAAGVTTNTALVLGMILAFHFGSTFSDSGATVYIGWEWITAIIVSNYLLELLIAVVATPPVIYALKKTVGKN